MSQTPLNTAPPCAIILARGVNALGMIRSLAKESVKTILVTDSRKDPAMLSRYPSKKFILPALKIDDLMDIITPYADNENVLMGASDEFISLISENQERLSNHFRILVPDQRLVEDLIDKRNEIELIGSTGIPLPPSLSRLPDDYRKAEENVAYPLIIKPRKSTGTALLKAKNKIITSRAGLENFYKNFREHLDSFIIQEIIPGEDEALWVCNCFFDSNAELIQAFSFKRMGTSPSHFGVTSYAESIQNQEIISQVKTLGKALRYTGPAMVEFKYDHRDGQFKYIEINPRIGMCNFFDTQCGINNVYATFRLAAGQAMEPLGIPQREGIIFINFFPDFISRLKDQEPVMSILKKYLRHISRSHVHAIWYWKDPLPAFSSIRNLFRLIYYLIRRLLRLK